MASDFDIKKAENNQYYWVLNAENGKTIARCSEYHPNKADAIHSVALVTRLAPDAPIWDLTGANPVRIDPTDVK